MDLNNVLDQMDLIDIYRILHIKSVEYIFFSRISYILDQKTSLDKLKNIEIISSNFSHHSGMKLENNYKNKTRKFTNMKIK